MQKVQRDKGGIRRIQDQGLCRRKENMPKGKTVKLIARKGITVKRCPPPSTKKAVLSGTQKRKEAEEH